MRGTSPRLGTQRKSSRAAARPQPGRDGRRDERGSSAVEYAILFPIIVILLFGGTQTAMWFFGREAATAAAQAGARAASVHGAPSGVGAAAADAYLGRVGSGTLSGYQADESADADTVSVHVHAAVINVIPLPGLNPSVDVTVTRPREVFTTPGGRP